jgi:alpha-ketoglutarate-dependent taurine dioxygenase
VLVSGVDPAEPLDDATVGALRQALDTWTVLFFQRPEPARFGRSVRVEPAVLDNSVVG